MGQARLSIYLLADVEAELGTTGTSSKCLVSEGSELETPPAREDTDMDIVLGLAPSYALQRPRRWVSIYLSKFVS
jgi:hypothetical protein